MTHCIRLGLLLAAGAALALGVKMEARAADRLPEPVQENLFVSKTGGYDTYRIPALAVTPKGTVLAFAEGRKTSSADFGDVDLVWRRSTDGGKTWSPMRLLHEEGGDAPITIGNPCVVTDRDTGAVLLLFCRNNRDVFITRSRDDGLSWSRPENITPQVKTDPEWTWYATGPGIGIQLERGPHRGRLVIPCDHRLRGDLIGSYAHVIYSDDHGKTWKAGGSAPYGSNECQVIERGDGTLYLSIRRAENNDGSDRAVSLSTDGGLTWSGLEYDKTLHTPRAQAGLLRFTPPGETKPIVLFTSPVHPRARWRLTARLSPDDGRTWPHARVIHILRAAYSSLGVLPDGTLLCLYEGGQEHYKENIRLARFSLDWVRAGDPRGEPAQKSQGEG
jgi:sialidase-1